MKNIKILLIAIILLVLSGCYYKVVNKDDPYDMVDVSLHSISIEEDNENLSWSYVLPGVIYISDDVAYDELEFEYELVDTNNKIEFNSNYDGATIKTSGNKVKIKLPEIENDKMTGYGLKLGLIGFKIELESKKQKINFHLSNIKLKNSSNHEIYLLKEFYRFLN